MSISAIHWLLKWPSIPSAGRPDIFDDKGQKRQSNASGQNDKTAGNIAQGNGFHIFIVFLNLDARIAVDTRRRPQTAARFRIVDGRPVLKQTVGPQFQDPDEMKMTENEKEMNDLNEIRVGKVGRVGTVLGQRQVEVHVRGRLLGQGETAKSLFIQVLIHDFVGHVARLSTCNRSD